MVGSRVFNAIKQRNFTWPPINHVTRLTNAFNPVTPPPSPPSPAATAVYGPRRAQTFPLTSEAAAAAQSVFRASSFLPVTMDSTDGEDGALAGMGAQFPPARQEMNGDYVGIGDQFAI